MSKVKEKPKLKVVVRGLPTQLSEEQFKASVGTHLENSDFWYFSAGRTSERKVIPSRAYINFTTAEALEKFKQEFNGHIFVTARGKEMRASVELAPFQKVPRPKRRVDPREATIETDADYLEFLQKLKEPQVNLPSAEEQLDKRLAEERERAAQGNTVEISPLLQYLREKKAMKLQKGRDRSERRKRNKEKKDKEPKPVTEKEKGPPQPNKKKERRKKKEGPAKKEEAQEDVGPKDDKRNNGVWIARKNMEPGSISILPKGRPTSAQQTQAPASSPQEPVAVTSKAAAPNNQQKQRERKPRPENRQSGGRKQEVKVYAPKQQRQEPNPVAKE